MNQTRRTMVTGAAAAGAILANAEALGQWRPSQRYPDPAVQVLDPTFNKYRVVSAAVERIATGMRWCEGPVWFGDGRYLLWSDIPNNAIMRWDEVTGRVSAFRKPSGYANGNTRDRQGRLITCEHEGRRVTRTEYDGTTTVLIDQFEGKRLNSPNDVVVKSDGSVWFTDPPFGIGGTYEGYRAEPELPQNVYRLDGAGKATVVEGIIRGPNGLCFSPDESKLYIVESRASPNRLILAYDVVERGTKIANKRTLIDCGQGTADGLRCDNDGNLWCGWGMGSDELDGVMVFSPDGKPIGRIQLPERCANLCFGGLKRDRLFMASSQSIYSLYVHAQGVPGG
jgi:gluconolactonase